MEKPSQKGACPKPGIGAEGWHMTAPVRALGCPSVGPFLTPTGILCVPLGAPSRGWRGLGGNSVRCSAPAAFMALQKSSPVAAGCFWCLLRASLCKLLSPWHMLWRARKKAGGKKKQFKPAWDYCWPLLLLMLWNLQQAGIYTTIVAAFLSYTEFLWELQLRLLFLLNTANPQLETVTSEFRRRIHGC